MTTVPQQYQCTQYLFSRCSLLISHQNQYVVHDWPQLTPLRTIGCRASVGPSLSPPPVQSLRTAPLSNHFPTTLFKSYGQRQTRKADLQASTSGGKQGLTIELYLRARRVRRTVRACSLCRCSAAGRNGRSLPLNAVTEVLFFLFFLFFDCPSRPSRPSFRLYFFFAFWGSTLPTCCATVSTPAKYFVFCSL